jgi:ArsR family transcriptional regulator
LRIVNLLATEGDLTVTALTRAVRVSQPLMSWHLRRLRRAGIVQMTRIGREVRCALDRERFADLQQRTFRLLMNRTEILR